MTALFRVRAAGIAANDMHFGFINDPRLVMPILEVLKDDHELYVRFRSLPSCGARDPDFRAIQDAYQQITAAAA